MKAKTPREILERGKEIIMENGWVQGNLFGLQDEVCSVGALERAAGTEHQRSDKEMRAIANAEYLLSAVMYNISFKNAQYDMEASVPKWNDEDGRTVSEVLAKFDEAILLAKEEEARA